MIDWGKEHTNIKVPHRLKSALTCAAKNPSSANYNHLINEINRAVGRLIVCRSHLEKELEESEKTDFCPRRGVVMSGEFRFSDRPMSATEAINLLIAGKHEPWELLGHSDGHRTLRVYSNDVVITIPTMLEKYPNDDPANIHVIGSTFSCPIAEAEVRELLSSLKEILAGQIDAIFESLQGFS